MGNKKWFIIFILGSLLVYNLLPIISKLNPSEGYDVIGFLSLIFINPLYLVISGLIYGKKCGFSWFFPAIMCFCFIPTVLIFYTPGYLFYLIIYFTFIIPSLIFGISLNKISRI